MWQRSETFRDRGICHRRLLSGQQHSRSLSEEVQVKSSRLAARKCLTCVPIDASSLENGLFLLAVQVDFFVALEAAKVHGRASKQTWSILP